MQLRTGHIIITLLVVIHCAGQGSEFQFAHMEPREWQSNHQITLVLGDSRGGMWLGTNNGLAYYDGAHFSEFNHSRDTNTIINNGINSLTEDAKGNIWGGTLNGVFCYLRKEYRFRRYYLPRVMDTNVWSVVCDSNGTVWANGWRGLLKLDIKRQQFDTAVYYQPTPQGPELLRMDRNSMLNDPTGQGLWLATRTGLKYYHKSNGRIDDAWSHPGHELFSHHAISALSITPDQRIWCFDNDTRELICFDPGTRRVLQRIPLAAWLPGGLAIATFQSSDSKVWICTFRNEMVVVDPMQQNKVVKLETDPTDPYSIKGNIFFSAYEDQDGIVWLCTIAGISKWYGNRALFRIHKLKGVVPVFQGNTHILQMATDTSNGSLWLITNNRQLIHYFPAETRHRVYDLNHTKAPGWIAAKVEINYVRLLDRKVLVCTKQGIFLLNPTSGALTPYQPLPAGFQYFTAHDVVSADNRIFYFASDKQVVMYNKETHLATLLPNLSEKTVGKNVGIGYMNVGPGNTMWIHGGNGWLAGYHNGKLDSVNLIADPLNESHGYVNWMDIDRKGNIWISFNQVGLYKFNPATRTITRYTQAVGMQGNGVAVAVADGYGNVWSGDRHQYSVLISNTEYFYNFTVPLHQENASWYLKMVLMKNGNIAAGAFQDVVEFFPERLLQKPVIQTPEISGIEVGGNLRIPADNLPLHLDAGDNSFVIRFGLLTDRQLFPYVMHWKLDGSDKTWQQDHNRNEAVYNKLPPGDYTFRVKAVSKNQLWTSPEKILQISIATPFYQTLWFRLIVAGLLLGLFYAFYRYRLYQQKQILELETRAATLEKEKTMIQYESLKQHLNPHFLFNSLTSLRSLIKSDSKTAGWFLDGLSRVYRHVLKSADQELVALQDEANFVQTFADLQQVRFGQGLQVHIRIDETCNNKYIAPVVLQNLVENAIKHNTTSPRSPLVIEIYTEDDSLMVRNNLQRYRVVETSNKQGLDSLKKLYSFYSDKPIEISEDEQYFIVRVPLL